MTLVFIGALLTGLGIYDDIAKFAGAGALVPITGFANAVASPALEFKTEGFVTGLASKLFIIAGPVIVYGTLASHSLRAYTVPFHLTGAAASFATPSFVRSLTVFAINAKIPEEISTCAISTTAAAKRP